MYYGNPQVVQNGLLIYYDFLNRNCWNSGSSTVYNLVGPLPNTSSIQLSSSFMAAGIISSSYPSYNPYYVSFLNAPKGGNTYGAISASFGQPIPLTQITVMVWFRWLYNNSSGDTNNYSTIAAFSSSADYKEGFFMYYSPGLAGTATQSMCVEGSFRGGSFANSCPFLTGPPATGSLAPWYNYAFTVDSSSTSWPSGSASGSIYAYQNGVVVASASRINNGTTGFNIYLTRLLLCGRYNAAIQAVPSGSIAHVMIYNRNLSAAEIAQNYNATKARFGY